MEPEYIIKPFKDLTNLELYELLHLRNQVFIVEQNCPYLDLDNKDQASYHLMYYVKGQLAGYTRLLPPGVSYKEMSIGRVVTSPDHRGSGLGKKIMEASIAGCYDKFGKSAIRISAQFYLLRFYQSLGFSAEGIPYDEDGIPHIGMIKHHK